MYTLAGMDLGRIVLAPPERRELKRRARKRSLAVELVKRAEVILMLAAGHSYREVRRRLDCSDEYIHGSGRSAFKRSVWRDLIRVITGVNAERGPLRLRRVSWRPRVKVPLTVRPTGAAIGWPESWALASRA